MYLESLLNVTKILSFLNRESKAIVLKWKVLKIMPIHTYMGGRACVCPWLNNFWWNVWILLNFLGLVQLLTSNFWAVVQDHPASQVQPWSESTLFLQNLPPPWVFAPQEHDMPSWNSGDCVKNRELNLDFWFGAQNIGVWIKGDAL